VYIGHVLPIDNPIANTWTKKADRIIIALLEQLRGKEDCSPLWGKRSSSSRPFKRKRTI